MRAVEYDVTLPDGSGVSELFCLANTLLHVVQAVAVLDVVDESASVFEDYEAYRVLQFPAFSREAVELVETHVFRIPQSFTDVFVGETIKRELEAAGVTGLRYVVVGWSGQPSASRSLRGVRDARAEPGCA